MAAVRRRAPGGEPKTSGYQAHAKHRPPEPHPGILPSLPCDHHRADHRPTSRTLLDADQIRLVYGVFRRVYGEWSRWKRDVCLSWCGLGWGDLEWGMEQLPAVSCGGQTMKEDNGTPDRSLPRRPRSSQHADPRTTMRYDRGCVSLDRHATYTVATFIAGAAR